MPKRIAILGSTGSIGKSALDVVRLYSERFEVAGLATHSNVDLLQQQIVEFRPACAAVTDPEAAEQLASTKPDIPVLSGPSGLEELAGMDADVVLCAVVGAAGLRPVLRAIEAGNAVALANKEALVMAGRLITARARDKGVDILPVDSEHSAIFQCLQGHDVANVHRILLTASGGPFYGRSRAELRDVAPDEATQHPTWNMGAKISVDSATLMNKGLEVIEAMWLFGVPLDKIEVIIHPQSIVHGLVEFDDGGVLAHLGITDMKFPILFALAWPERVRSCMGRLDLTQIGALSFAAPEVGAFPCLHLALEAARAGGTAPALLNAANEVAVAAFCGGRIGFLGISEVVETVMAGSRATHDDSLESVLAADAWAREKAASAVEALGAGRPDRQARGA